jgi:DNA repair exonuclease SbcCD ATPase subunit
MTTKDKTPVTVEALPLIKFDLTAAGLAKIKKACLAITEVPTNGDEYKALTAQIAQVRDTRVAIEHRRKELKAPLLAWSGKLDAKAKELKETLTGMEAPLHELKEKADAIKLKKKEEKAAKARKRLEALQEKLTAIRQPAIQATYEDYTAEWLEDQITQLEALEITPETFEEMAPLAEVARQETLTKLRGLAAGLIAKAEAEAKRKIELEELAEARKQQEKIEAEQAETQRKLDAQREEQEAAQRKIDEAAEKQAKEAAEKEAADLAEKERKAALKKTKAEQKKLLADSVELETFLDELTAIDSPVLTSQEGKLILGEFSACISDWYSRLGGMETAGKAAPEKLQGKD